MKRIAASVGLVALGASALHNVKAAGLADAAGGKPWSVSATLRGFYDDNIYTQKGTNRISSFGVQVEPSVGFTLVQDQTSYGGKYTYSGNWYETKQVSSFGHWSHSHEFQGDFSHTFTPHLSVWARDSFVVGQEPDSLRSDSFYQLQQYVQGNNIRNSGKIVADYQFSREFSLEAGYGNNFWDYANQGTVFGTNGPIVTVAFSSLSGELDRIEHAPYLEANWQLAPQTRALLGYSFGQVNFTGDEVIAGIVAPTNIVLRSSDRDSRSHHGYAGLEHTFNPSLSGSVRAGIVIRDQYKSSGQPTDTAPYVNAGLNYAPTPDTSVGLTFAHDLNVTDVVGNDPANYVRGQENSVVSLNISHALTPAVTLSGIGSFQYSEILGGTNFNGKTEQFYTLGLNLDYRINRQVSVHIGYNFDHVSSDVGRDYDRNRYYAGVTASY